jgi:NADPH:quinone reductase
MGARVLGTARKEAKIERARSLGLDEGVVPQGGAFASKVLELTNNRGVDLILELVGGDYVGEDLACTTMRGRILLVGLVAGLRTDLDLGALLRKRITMIGTVLRARPLEEKIAVANAFAHHVVPLLDTRALRPVVDRVLPLAEASAAHAYVATNEGFGKVVLTV